MNKILGLLTLFTLIGCSSPAELTDKDIHQALYFKVANQNSYGGQLQDSMSIIDIKRLGEFGLTRIKRFHRRYDFDVTLRFNQNCYQLGNTCLSQKVFNTINNPSVYTKRKKNDTIKKKYFISFIKTKKGWNVVDDNIKYPSKPTLKK
jgi:ubiquitin C-terminal hydrolase